MHQEKMLPNGSAGNNSHFLLFIEVIHLQLSTLSTLSTFFFISPPVHIITLLLAEGTLK